MHINVEYSRFTVHTAHLSSGEAQRLVIARLLVQQPLLAVLDEATSAMSLEMEAQAYAALTEAGITVLSFGQRPSLRALHACTVVLDGDGGGGWRVLSDSQALHL